jgi:hypothetical protein
MREVKMVRVRLRRTGVRANGRMGGREGGELVRCERGQLQKIGGDDLGVIWVLLFTRPITIKALYDGFV